MNRLLLHDDARDEYIASYIWYHESGSHIAEAFEQEIEHALESLRKFPDRWPVYTGSWHRVLLRRFPFGIVFKNMDTQIIVVAIMLTRRKPGYWKSRMFDALPNRK